MKQLLNIFICLLPAFSFSQSIERQVIGSCAFDVVSSTHMSAAVGQPEYLTHTGPGQKLTQGFEQPFIRQQALVSFSVAQDMCTNAYTVTLTGFDGCLNESSLITWNNVGGELVFTTINDSVQLDVFGGPGCHFESTLIFDEMPLTELPCTDDFYQLITPNDDGHNDGWIIGQAGQSDFAIKIVTIFNRWGGEVWSAQSYNNIDVWWTGQTTDGRELPDGTYFYLVETDSRTYSGFVELQR